MKKRYITSLDLAQQYLPKGKKNFILITLLVPKISSNWFCMFAFASFWMVHIVKIPQICSYNFSQKLHCKLHIFTKNSHQKYFVKWTNCSLTNFTVNWFHEVFLRWDREWILIFCVVTFHPQWINMSSNQFTAESFCKELSLLHFYTQCSVNYESMISRKIKTILKF